MLNKFNKFININSRKEVIQNKLKIKNLGINFPEKKNVKSKKINWCKNILQNLPKRRKNRNNSKFKSKFRKKKKSKWIKKRRRYNKPKIKIYKYVNRLKKQQKKLIKHQNFFSPKWKYVYKRRWVFMKWRKWKKKIHKYRYQKLTLTIRRNYLAKFFQQPKQQILNLATWIKIKAKQKRYKKLKIKKNKRKKFKKLHRQKKIVKYYLKFIKEKTKAVELQFKQKRKAKELKLISLGLLPPKKKNKKRKHRLTKEQLKEKLEKEKKEVDSVVNKDKTIRRLKLKIHILEKRNIYLRIKPKNKGIKPKKWNFKKNLKKKKISKYSSINKFCV